VWITPLVSGIVAYATPPAAAIATAPTSAATSLERRLDIRALISRLLVRRRRAAADRYFQLAETDFGPSMVRTHVLLMVAGQSPPQAAAVGPPVSVTTLPVWKKMRHAFPGICASQFSGPLEPVRSTPARSLVTDSPPPPEHWLVEQLPPAPALTMSSESPGGAQVSVTAPSTE
jgi:hypothetical protein